MSSAAPDCGESRQTCFYTIVYIRQHLRHEDDNGTVNGEQRIQIIVMGIQRLPRAVSTTIVSTSSVQSQVSVLKELIENAIDAIGDLSQGQIYIEVDKDSAGLDFLSVKDNGAGVEKTDRKVMCLNCTTSKLSSLDQLSCGVSTCGFRGEALNFIAHLAKTVQISTKTKSDVTMETWSVNNLGVPNSDSKVSPGSVGTTVKVFGLFEETPVRYKFLKEKRTKFLRNMEHLITEYVLIYRNIRFQLRYVKLLPNGRTVNGDCKSYPHKISPAQLLCDLLDIRKKNWLFEKKFEFEVPSGLNGSFTVEVTVLLPKMRAQDIPASKHNFKLLSVNKRPLDLSLRLGKLISAKVNESYSENMLLVPPVWFLNMSIPLDKVDVNIEPGKCDIIVCNENGFIEAFKEKLVQTIAMEHQIDRVSNVVSNSDKVQMFQVPPLIAERGRDDHIESIQTSKEFIANNAPDAQFSEKAENILESNDDSFVHELNSTVNDMKNRYENNLTITYSGADHAGPNSNFNSNIDDTNSKEVTLFVPDSDETVDRDNDWSSTVYDTTRFSSEIDIGDEIVTLSGNCGKTVDPSCLSKESYVEASELPGKSEHSRIEKTVDDTTSITPADTNLLTGQISDNLSKKRTVDNIKNHAPESKQKKMNSLKQMSVSSYLTYHLSPPKKRVAAITKQEQVPRIGALSQETFLEKLDVAFELSLDIDKRHHLLAQDETWVNRCGIPSTNLVQGAVNLYERLSHEIVEKTPQLDESGIYQLK